MSFFKTCTAFQTKKSKVLWQAWKPRPSSVICVLENFYCNRTLMRGEEALIAISGCIRHRICFAILLWTPIILHCELKCQMSAVRMSACRDFVLTDDFNSEIFSQSQETWAKSFDTKLGYWKSNLKAVLLERPPWISVFRSKNVHIAKCWQRCQEC